MAEHGPPSGDQIRRAREALRMTQQQLADELGVGLRTVGRWERGEAAPRSAVGALIRILQMPVDDDGNTHANGDGATNGSRGPYLREASDVEFIAELARRLAGAQDPHRELPPIPQVRLSWPRTAAPSAHRLRDMDDNEQRRNTGP